MKSGTDARPSRIQVTFGEPRSKVNLRGALDFNTDTLTIGVTLIPGQVEKVKTILESTGRTDLTVLHKKRLVEFYDVKIVDFVPGDAESNSVFSLKILPWVENEKIFKVEHKDYIPITTYDSRYNHDYD